MRSNVMFGYALALCAMIGSPFVWAQSISLSASDTSLSVDDEITITVSVNTGQQEVQGITCGIEFDSSVVDVERKSSDPTKPNVTRNSQSPFVVNPGALLSGGNRLDIPFVPLDGLDNPVAYNGPVASFKLKGKEAAVDSMVVPVDPPTLIALPDGTKWANVTLTGIKVTVTGVTNTILLSGRVTKDGSGEAGVTIGGTGLNPAPVTGTDGKWSASVSKGFTGTVIPSKTNLKFTPDNIEISAAQTQLDLPELDFAATNSTLTISGRVTRNDAGESGVTVTPSPGTAVMTNASGDYTLTVSNPFTGTVTPTKSGTTFSPANKSYTAITSDQTAQDYTVEECTAVLSADQTATSVAGSAEFMVTGAGENGKWSITDNQDWATVSPSSGTGNGTVTVTYGENVGVSASQRSVTLTVNRTDCTGGSDTAVLRQDAPDCTVSLSADQTATSVAGSAEFMVTGAGENGKWSITDNQDWATVSPSSGTGNGTVTVTYGENVGVSASQRSVTLTVNRTDCTGGSDTAVLRQDAPECKVSVSPSQSVAQTAGTSQLSVTTTGAWSITSNQGWATATPTSGKGDGNVTVTYTANGGESARSATFTVTRTDCEGGSDTATITQDGTPVDCVASPQDVSADDSVAATVCVTWSPVANAVGYKVYRTFGDTTPFGNATFLGTVASSKQTSGTLSYCDDSVEEGVDLWLDCLGRGLVLDRSAVPAAFGCWSYDSVVSESPIYKYYVTAIGPNECESEPGSDIGSAAKQLTSSEASVLSGDTIVIGAVMLTLLLMGLFVARRQSRNSVM